MPPLRTMSSIKPIKTERTHEENQERAYIAASRRSDRSLEARVESARRASEIHKRRTGRSLRVTEQDVINEEMYEEEDDDLPMQYRRLTAHLQTANSAFNHRIQAYLSQQVAFRQAMGNVAADNWQMNNQQFNNNQQFMNPGMMQMQQPGYQNSMMPPQAFNRSMNYRQTPYPMPQNNMQAMRQQNVHNRSASVATPQDLTQYQQQQQSASAQASPVDAIKMEDRRMSLPAQNAMPQTPQSQQGSTHSPVISRNGSSGNLATPHAYMKHSQSPQQAPTPPQYQQQQYRPQSQSQSQQMMSSPFTQSFDQMMNSGCSPLTATLPVEAQQFLFDAPQSDMNMSQMFNQVGLQSQQRMYSYNPNGKPKNNSASSQPPAYGLQQTLMGPPLDTTTLSAISHDGFMTSPESAGADNLITPNSFTDFNFGSYEDYAKTGSSGDVTPSDLEFVNDGFYGEFIDASAA